MRQLIFGVQILIGLDMEAYMNMFIWDIVFEFILLVEYLIVKMVGLCELKLIGIFLFFRLGGLRLTLSVQTLNQLCLKRISKISLLVLRYVLK